MSLYSEYLLERRGLAVLEDEAGRGFCTFAIKPGESVYIQDIYVQAEHRKSGLAAAMADRVADLAREQRCTVMFGSVDPAVPSATISLAVLIAYGFRLLDVDKTRIILHKDI